MSGPSWTQQGGAKKSLGPSWTRPKPAPAGNEIVETFDDGGRIVKNLETGQESYIKGAYATGDAARISEIRAAGGDSGKTYKRGVAGEIVDQFGELPSRIVSAAKGVPFIGSYFDDVLEAVGRPEGASAMRASQEAREILAPKTVAASRAGVGIGTALTALPSLPAAVTTTLGPSLLGRLVTGAGLGTLGGLTEGGIYGFGEGKTMEERKEAAISGGKTGAAFGAVLGPLGPLAGAAAGKLRQRSVTAPVRAAEKEIGAKGQALDLLSQASRMDAPVSKEAMERAGQYASLGQQGPATRNLLDLAASSTSEGAAIARQNIDEVAGEAGDQFNRLLDTSFGGPQAAQAVEDALMQSTAGQRRELYDTAYEAAIDYSEPAANQLEELLSRVDSDVISNAEKLMRREGQPSSQIMAKLDEAGNVTGYETLPDVRQIDYLTRALNNVSPTAAPEDKNTARALAGQIRKSLDALVPEYRTARDLAGDVISMRDALDLGTDALKGGKSAPTRYDLKKAMEGMSDAEIGALKQGVRSHIDEIMANTKAALTDPNQDAREMIAPLKDMMSRAGREKLETILGGEAKDFIRQLDEVYSVMSMRASVAQNSKTQVRKMAQDAAEDRIQQDIPELMGERGPVTGLLEGLRRSASTKPSKQQAFEQLMGEIAQPLTRQGDLNMLQRQIEMLQQAAPQLQRGRNIYETGKRLGTAGAIGLTPAMQSLLGGR